MKKRIITFITACILMAMLALTASAEGLTPEAITSLREEYEQAHVVLDIYCLGIYTGSGYDLTDAYADLDLSRNLDDPEELDALAQEAMEITFADGSTTVPVKEGAKLDVKIQDLPLGLYLIIPHGSDLSVETYIRTIQTEDGTEKQVSIARTEEYEYHFSPVLLAMDYDHVDVKTEIKAERSGRFGRSAVITARIRPHLSSIWTLQQKTGRSRKIMWD